jgi:DNA-binding transcriptional regulator PaaX
MKLLLPNHWIGDGAMTAFVHCHQACCHCPFVQSACSNRTIRKKEKDKRSISLL